MRSTHIRLLNIDHRAKNCIIMVSIVWAMLTIITVYLFIDFVSLYVSSQWLLTLSAITLGSIQLLLYRHLIYHVALSGYRNKVAIKLYGFLSSFIILISCLPSILQLLIGDLPNTLSLYERLTFNSSILTLFIILIILIVTINIIALMALSVSCRNLSSLVSLWTK